MRCLAGLLVCLCALAAAADEVRTWTKVQGDTIKAQFIREVDGDVVFLRDGKLVTIPFDQLSEGDQKLIRELEKDKKIEETTVPLGAPTPKVDPPQPDAPPLKPDKTIEQRPTLIKPRVLAEIRVWSDLQGKKSSGKFVRIHDGNVILARTSGRVFEMPYKLLSREDQLYVRGLLTARGEAHLCPPLSDDNAEVAPNGLVAASPDRAEFPDGAPELTGPHVAGRTPLHDQTRDRFGQPESAGDGESSVQQAASGNLDVVALQPSPQDNASATRGVSWPELPKFSAKQIRAIIIVSAINLIVGSTLGSVILRTAIYLFNEVFGVTDSRDAVPEPTYGEGVGIIFFTMIAYSVAGFVAAFAIGFGCALAGLEQQQAGLYARIVFMPLALLVVSGMFSSMLPTSFFRALLIAVCYIVIWILIVAAILVGMFAFGFR